VLEEMRRLGKETFAASAEFDNGMASGYRDGLGQQAGTHRNGTGRSCSAHASQTDPFCDGYHRGFGLGKADRAALSGTPAILEASR
jgi:hypothetical protein